MTEKRFKFADGYSLRYNCIIDNLKGEDKDIHNVLKTDEVLNMLNKLYEENEELKEQLKDCTKKAKEEIRRQAENDAIRWANIGR